jgi:hypothetical protein
MDNDRALEGLKAGFLRFIGSCYELRDVCTKLEHHEVSDSASAGSLESPQLLMWMIRRQRMNCT